MSHQGRIAVIGMGRMGAAMAGTLSRAGFPLVLWNRTRPRAEAVAATTGATIATSPAEAAASAAVTISSLADDVAVRDAYLGPDGVAAGIGSGAIALDTSTIDPQTEHQVGDAVDAAGGGFLDAPVSGTVSTVEQGALTFMVGGEASLISRARPVLEALGKRIIHVGPRGSGAAVKLANNALVHGLNVALSEALVLAERAGVDRAIAYEVLASGTAGAPYVHYKRASFEDPDGTPVAFSIDLMAKDLTLITGLAHRAGLSLPQAEVGLEMCRRAIEGGLGQADLSAIAVHLRSIHP